MLAYRRQIQHPTYPRINRRQHNRLPLGYPTLLHWKLWQLHPKDIRQSIQGCCLRQPWTVTDIWGGAQWWNDYHKESVNIRLNYWLAHWLEVRGCPEFHLDKDYAVQVHWHLGLPDHHRYSRADRGCSVWDIRHADDEVRGLHVVPPLSQSFLLQPDIHSIPLSSVHNYYHSQ